MSASGQMPLGALARRAVRALRNRTLYGGFSPVAAEYLKRARATTGRSGPAFVNLSFDLELALDGYFWRGEFRKALAAGDAARRNLEPIVRLLTARGIPFNVQVLCGLLDRGFANAPFLDAARKHVIAEHPELFRLTDEDVALLGHEAVVPGIHAYSHRTFDTLDRAACDRELELAIDHFVRCFGRRPRFMSFPKNRVAHADLLARHGVTAWRAETDSVSQPGEVPLGLWLSPATFTPNALTRFLDRIAHGGQGGPISLWGHFHEMEAERFARYLDALQRTGLPIRAV